MYAGRVKVPAAGKTTEVRSTSSPFAIVGKREAGGVLPDVSQSSIASSSARSVQRCCAKFSGLRKSPVLVSRIGGSGPPECGVPLSRYSRDESARGTSRVPSSVVCVSDPARAQYSVDENV